MARAVAASGLLIVAAVVGAAMWFVDDDGEAPPRVADTRLDVDADPRTPDPLHDDVADAVPLFDLDDVVPLREVDPTPLVHRPMLVRVVTADESPVSGATVRWRERERDAWRSALRDFSDSEKSTALLGTPRTAVIPCPIHSL